MTHDLITIARGMLFCRQCKQTWQKSDHHLARMTECVGEFPEYPLYTAHQSSAESNGAALIAAWEKETGRE
jgi:hypothetical protein